MNRTPIKAFVRGCSLLLASLLLASASLIAQPVIPSGQPADQTVLAGTTATFSAAISGAPGRTNQWRYYFNCDHP